MTPNAGANPKIRNLKQPVAGFLLRCNPLPPGTLQEAMQFERTIALEVSEAQAAELRRMQEEVESLRAMHETHVAQLREAQARHSPPAWPVHCIQSSTQ